jgi:hypothetical protein
MIEHSVCMCPLSLWERELRLCTGVKVHNGIEKLQRLGLRQG